MPVDVQSAEILICQLRTRIERDRKAAMFPKLQGAASAFDKLHHALEAKAEKFLARVQSTDAKSDDVFKRAHAKIDTGDKFLDDVDEKLKALDQVGNGPPTDGDLRESS